MDSKELQRRKLILYNCTKYPNLPKSTIAKLSDVSSRTVYRVVSRFLTEGTVERKAGSGKNNTSGDKSLPRKLKQALLRNPQLSTGFGSKTSNYAIKCHEIEAKIKF